jgi:hypothetical protein
MMQMNQSASSGSGGSRVVPVWFPGTSKASGSHITPISLRDWVYWEPLTRPLENSLFRLVVPE